MVYVLCASTPSSSLSDSLAVAPTQVERCGHTGHGCGRGRLTRITGVLKQTSRFRLGRDEGRKFDIDSPPTPMLAIRLPSPPFLLSLYPILLLLFYLISLLRTGGRCPNRECETSSSVRPSPLSAKKRARPAGSPEAKAGAKWMLKAGAMNNVRPYQTVPREEVGVRGSLDQRSS